MEYRFLGVLPYTYTPNNKLVFLLGQEWPGHTEDAYFWGTFGGGPEKEDLSLYHGAARECYEESMGFLGTQGEILERILRAPFVLKESQVIIFPMFIEYDSKLPQLYNRVYEYAQKCVKSCPEGWLEKLEIAWWSPQEILNSSEQMRPAFNRFFKRRILPAFLKN